MPPELPNLFFAALAILFGAFVQTSIGFGMAIVAAPFLFFLDPAYIPGPMIVASLVNCVFTSWHYRSSLALGELSSAMIARLPGSLVGVALLLAVSVEVLAVLIALVIISGMLLTALNIRIPFTKTNLAWAGFFSGVMGTSTSIGGPPVALVMQGQEANRIRGNLGAFFVFSTLTSLCFLIPAGRFGMNELMLGAGLVIPAWLGSWLASLTSHRISDIWLRRATLVLCAAAVVAMLIQHLSR